MHHPLRDSGFTLVELLIVMVVAGILAMVAVPSYQESVRKSRRTDAKVVLNNTAQRLERCYSQFGAYNAAGCAIQDDDEILSAEEFYTVTVDVPDAATYTLTADPAGTAQADDVKCGWLELTNTGARDAESGDLEHCW